MEEEKKTRMTRQRYLPTKQAQSHGDADGRAVTDDAGRDDAQNIKKENQKGERTHIVLY